MVVLLLLIGAAQGGWPSYLYINTVAITAHICESVRATLLVPLVRAPSPWHQHGAHEGHEVHAGAEDSSHTHRAHEIVARQAPGQVCQLGSGYSGPHWRIGDGELEGDPHPSQCHEGQDGQDGDEGHDGDEGQDCDEGQDGDEGHEGQVSPAL
jgi:hypothetical protein